MEYEKLENQITEEAYSSSKYALGYLYRQHEAVHVAEQESKKRCQLLFKVLCLPEFLVKFRRRLDYDRFSDLDCSMLPVQVPKS